MVDPPQRKPVLHNNPIRLNVPWTLANFGLFVPPPPSFILISPHDDARHD